MIWVTYCCENKLYPLEMPKAIVTLRINKRIVEAECSVCHEVIMHGDEGGSSADEEQRLKEAIVVHTKNRHRDGHPEQS